MSKRKLLTVGASLLAAGLIAGSATAASASVGGNPNPTPSPTYTHPTPPPTPRVLPWQFDFTGANIDGLTLNDVRGVGAIPMVRWQEQDLSPFTSKFFRGPNSVTLAHNRLPLPRIHLNTCTATFDQVGRFRVIAGTGIGANLRNVRPGVYILRGLLSFDKVNIRNYHSVCPLQFTNPWTLRALTESNHLNVAGQYPSLVDFDVQGNALLVRVPVVTPHPTPSQPGHFFAPAASPTASA
jgi:hypothetical protein